MSIKTYRPGEVVSISGIYAEIDRNSFYTGRRVTSVRGEAFPPTQFPGCWYVLERVTNP